MQYRALKYVYNDYEMDNEILLEKANMDSLDLYIHKFMLVEIYIAVNSIGATYLSGLFTLNKTNTRRRGLDLFLPHVDSGTYGIHSLRYHGAKLWAKLPRGAKTAPNVDAFKSALVNFKGITCKCAMCKYQSNT